MVSILNGMLHSNVGGITGSAIRKESPLVFYFDNSTRLSRTWLSFYMLRQKGRIREKWQPHMTQDIDKCFLYLRVILNPTRVLCSCNNGCELDVLEEESHLEA